MLFGVTYFEQRKHVLFHGSFSYVINRDDYLNLAIWGKEIQNFSFDNQMVLAYHLLRNGVKFNELLTSNDIAEEHYISQS